jgi:hypothetical protein
MITIIEVVVVVLQRLQEVVLVVVVQPPLQEVVLVIDL